MRVSATPLCMIALVLSSLAFGTDCPFESSVYEDLDGNGFRLEFGPSQVNSVRVVHSAIITHPVRGTVFEFDFIHGMGYAQAFLVPRDAKDHSAAQGIHFFDEHLRSSGPGDFAEPYAFVEELGSTDWYGDPSGKAREIPIGTPLWKFVHCREAPEAPGSAERDKQTGSKKKLSSAERVTEDGRIAAYGDIKILGEKEGQRFLSIDYGQWISEEECRRRVIAGALNMDESDCEVDSLRYVCVMRQRSK